MRLISYSELPKEGYVFNWSVYSGNYNYSNIFFISGDVAKPIDVCSQDGKAVYAHNYIADGMTQVYDINEYISVLAGDDKCMLFLLNEYEVLAHVIADLI